MEEQRATVCAVVVTYHPDGDVLDNVRALLPQVGRLVVVDNGSSEAELEPLRGLAAAPRFELVENGDNLGIATALNTGVRLGVEGGAEWVLLFDQDSQVTPGFVPGMLRAFAASEFGERLGLLVPVYRDKRSGAEIVTDRLPGGGVEAAMTSGSLVRARTFAEHGYFLDELFIDMVDSEYSLRLRAAGLMLEETEEAVLLHSPATPRSHTMGGRRMFVTGNYSAVRHYYQQRNRVWVARRYGRRFPGYIRRLVMHSVKELVKIVLGEREKGAKVRAFFAGLRDGVRGRMGKRQVRRVDLRG